MLCLFLIIHTFVSSKWKREVNCSCDFFLMVVCYVYCVQLCGFSLFFLWCELLHFFGFARKIKFKFGHLDFLVRLLYMKFCFFPPFCIFIFGFWVLWGERNIKVFLKAYFAFCYYFSFHLGLILPSWFSKSSHSILKVSSTWLFFHIAFKVALETWWILFDCLPKILSKILNTYL